MLYCFKSAPLWAASFSRLMHENSCMAFLTSLVVTRFLSAMKTTSHAVRRVERVVTEWSGRQWLRQHSQSTVVPNRSTLAATARDVRWLAAVENHRQRYPVISVEVLAAQLELGICLLENRDVAIAIVVDCFECRQKLDSVIGLRITVAMRELLFYL